MNGHALGDLVNPLRVDEQTLKEFAGDQIPLVWGRVNIILLIGVLFVPFFGWVDYVLYPERFARFMSYRLISSASCLMLLAINRKWNLGYRSFWLGVAGYYVVGSTIIRMILATDGYSSPYYAGLNLVFLTFITVLTVPVQYLMLHSGILYGIFVISVWLFDQPKQIELFLANNMFVISTIVILLVASYTNYRLRLREYLLRKELKAAQEELVRKERLAVLGKLTAVVSHEIRNPLGTIRSSLFSVGELTRGKGLGVERALDRADRNVVRCDRIIEELLDYTRARHPDLEATFLDEWLNELLDELAIPENITVTRNLVSNVVVKLDRERFRRCILNVISNACQAMVETQKEGSAGEACGPKGLLTVASRLTGERVEVCVRDTGMGIAPDEVEKIFQPLYSTKGFGVGLGLPIVKQIMEQHHGGIEIESTPGGGTSVVLWLPMGNNIRG
jgi:signal transduction histidine kinase